MRQLVLFCVAVMVTLVAGQAIAGSLAAIAPGGSLNDGQTSIVLYNANGELGVDVPAGTELTSMNIDSASGIFAGDPAQNLGGSFDNHDAHNIFKATFGSSFGSLSFGNVVEWRSWLREDFFLNDITVIGSLAGGGGLGDVDCICFPEPSSLLLALLGIVGLLHWRRWRT